MASNSSSSLFDVFYKNHNRGLKGSIIPNMDSTRVNQQYDSSAFNTASYTTPYIPNQQNFSGLMPFPNDLPSQMAVEPLFSDPLFMESSSSSSYSSPFFKHYNNLNGLMSFPNDLPSQMEVDQLFSPLNLASSSSSYSSPFAKNYDDFNELMPFSNELASEMGFMGTTIGQNEVEIFNGLTPFLNEIPSEMGFSQPASRLNEPERSDGLIPFPNDDIPSKSGIVDDQQNMGDGDFTIDLDAMDLQFMTKWLEQEAELDHELTNDGALATNTSESLNLLTPENTNFESTNNGVRANSVISIGVPPTSNLDAKPFGKKGLLLFETPTNKPWESRKLKTAMTVQITAANFFISEGLTNTYRRNDEHQKAGPQLNVQRSNRKTKKVKPLSLAERLEGWTIEIRKRANGLFEKFYYHENSKHVFRSTIEVENFIIDEIYPPKRPQNSSNKRNS